MNKYHKQGCTKNSPCVKNAVFFGRNETFNHALAKSIGALMLLKYGDLKFNQIIINNLNVLCESIDVFVKSMPFQKEDFITEAVPNNVKNRRIDLVRLRDDVWYEFVKTNLPNIEDEKNTVVIEL